MDTIWVYEKKSLYIGNTYKSIMSATYSQMVPKTQKGIFALFLNFFYKFETFSNLVPRENTYRYWYLEIPLPQKKSDKHHGTPVNKFYQQNTGF